MVFFLDFFKIAVLVIPFVSVVFYPFWNAKIYSILNFLIISSSLFFVIDLYLKKTVNVVYGYIYLIYFFFVYLVSFSLSPVRDIISAEYISFVSGLIIFTLVLNSKKLDFRYYYFLFFLILFIFIVDNFFDLDISSKGNTNLFAFVFLIIIGILLENKNYYSAIPFFIAILFTKSYAAILSIFFVSLLYMFRKTKLDEFKKNKFIYIILTLLIFFLIINLEEKSIYDRLSWWNTAIKIFYDRFFIGWGYSAFTHIFNAYSSGGLNTIYPHNFLLSILAEGGFFAFLFFVIFLYNIVKQVETINKYVIIALFFHSLFDIGLDTTCGWWLFMYYLGISSKKTSRIIFLKSFDPKLFYSTILILLSLLFSFIRFSYSLIDIERTIDKAIYFLSLSKYNDALSIINELIKKYPSSIDLAKTRVLIYSRYINDDKELLPEYLSSLEYLLVLNPYQKEIYEILKSYYKKIDKKAFDDIQKRESYYIKR